MKRLHLIGWVGVILLLLSACGTSEENNAANGTEGMENTLGWEVGTLEATTHAGESFSTDDMDGTVYIADFIFTSCETVCPPMTRNMVQLQQKMQEEGVKAEIVSFSVDPNVDTPEKLTQFGEKYGADIDSNWTFVTGYEQQTIADFAKSSFKTQADKIQDNDQVIHGSSFYLVSKDGIVLKKYSGAQEVPYDEIIADAKKAAK
ncbi:SCO family protein [Halobacillus salinus]|uniref:SCO family protein n=1 Tax=Halobacillus salinus TaxID=192814 RepID=UPI0009A6FEA4|nr:SCO family protein [Halobacillus salinus]